MSNLKQQEDDDAIRDAVRRYDKALTDIDFKAWWTKYNPDWKRAPAGEVVTVYDAWTAGRDYVVNLNSNRKARVQMFSDANPWSLSERVTSCMDLWDTAGFTVIAVTQVYIPETKTYWATVFMREEKSYE